MSGHSKWSTIKRQKGAADVKRGALFTKLANVITLAARTGADPEFNPRLRMAVDKARAQNMPMENIRRAIERARGGANEASFEEITYEGFAPGNIGMLISAATDNKNRTLSFIKTTLDKGGGALASQGAVSWQFKPVGEIVVALDGKTLDDLYLTAADAGAEDVIPNDEEEGTAIVQTAPDQVEEVRTKLTGWKVQESKLSHKPTSKIEIPDEDTAGKVIDLIDELESNEDIQEVVSNLG